MKILFFSDIHGSPGSLKLLDRHIQEIQPEQLVLLGDALYHGPRNALPADYSTPDTASWLNARAGQIIAVRGNCDTEVDQMVLCLPIMADYSMLLDSAGHRFFLTHGHHWNPEKLPPLPAGSVFCYGHTHIPKRERTEQGIFLFNPGSVTIPKGGFKASFGI